MHREMKKVMKLIASLFSIVFVILAIIAKWTKKDTIYDNIPGEKNPMEGKKVIFVASENDEKNADGVKGHLEALGDSNYHPRFYEKYIKRLIDIILSFAGLVILSPVFAVIAIAIKIEDPGPALFTQKRLGQNKQYFKLHKFRSMKVSTPHDVPTHMLENPEQYITKVGGFIRRHSLDELPQIWDIFVGNLTTIGPRPGLWNQDRLTAERDKYGANDVKPGLTGWAQINGRDELEIPVKAKLDGEYVQKLGIWMDIKCFLGSLHVFGKDESVIEGGTGELRKKSNKVCRHYTDGKSTIELIGHIGFGEPVQVDWETHRYVLITGAGSYIGESFRTYAAEHYRDNFTISTIDLQDPSWREHDFSKYDIVYHVAGIAHADVGNVSDETKEKYYSVNTDLAIEVAKKAKEEGVGKFIFMSSMIVYGESAPYGKKKVIDCHTIPTPENFYGDSKLQADVGVRNLADNNFKVIVLRPPMIYGKGSKGNYSMLSKLAKKLPMFPDVDNERSMLHIENLCEFLCQIMLVKNFRENAIILIPQNKEWTKTCEMVKDIAEISGKKIKVTKLLNIAVCVGSKMPGKLGGLVNKAFGNMTFDAAQSEYEGINYQMNNRHDSILKTEQRIEKNVPKELLEQYSVLMSVYYKEKPDELVQSIESMLNQTVRCSQFVIVKDGSLTSELDEILQKYNSEYPELFTIVPLKKNVGLAKALDKGLEYCKEDLVARMDADDISLPTRCEKLLCLFYRNQQLSLAGTNIDEFYDDPSEIVSSRIVPSDYENICKYIRRRSPFNHPTVMFRKKEVQRCGGYGNMRRKQDLDLFARMINENCYALNINESLLLFRSNKDSYKRRKSWEYCKSYIDVEYVNYKRGYCSFVDLAIVIAGQLFLYLAPSPLMKAVSDHLLREKK